MEDIDDLSTYNGDVEHDMWVDYDNFRHTGAQDYFDDEPDDECDEFDEVL